MKNEIQAAAVIVIYNPDLHTIKLINTCLSTFEVVVVVNNGASNDFIETLGKNDKLNLINNKKNYGLATAFNQGLSKSFSNINIDAVVLFDQDSEINLDFSNDMKNSYMKAINQGLKIACIGPMLIDMKSPDAKIHYEKIDTSFLLPVDTIASSGSLIPRVAYDAIGPMLDSLFIDCVDHEWCHRASSKNYGVFVDVNIKLNHNMGENYISYFGQYKPVYRSPIRHYYIVRNTIFLAKLTYVPLRWRLVEILKTVRRIIYYALISNSRLKSMSLMIRAIKHGLCNQLGELET